MTDEHGFRVRHHIQHRYEDAHAQNASEEAEDDDLRHDACAGLVAHAHGVSDCVDGARADESDVKRHGAIDATEETPEGESELVGDDARAGLWKGYRSLG